MQPNEPGETFAQSGLEDDGPRMVAPLSWHVRNFLRLFRIPLVVAIIVLGWIYVPLLEARSQQNALATEFFNVCRKTLRDTSQIPKVPEEALEEAVKKRPLTESAFRSWAPQVASEIRNKQWIARIEFMKPSGYVIEQTIGPVLAEAGYDTPSAGP